MIPADREAFFEQQRSKMVQEQLRARGITDQRLLAAFLKVPRHLFVPAEYRNQAYEDHPLPIGFEQTISQPYIVGLMIHSLALKGHERVLEIGGGSGYQTALLAEMALEVHSIERIPELMVAARRCLHELGYSNVAVTAGNGSLGLPEKSPFDAIIVSAASPQMPKPLLGQLNDPGRMVLPLGDRQAQSLVRVEKRHGQMTTTELGGCMFVPLLGEYGWPSGQP